MPKSSRAFWIAIFSSGLAVAAFTFGAERVWDAVRHRSVGPQYVDGTIRVEDAKILIFVRNNSDDPLDLKSARLYVRSPSGFDTPALGVYPDVSKLYSALSSDGRSSVAIVDGELVVTLQIVQAIEPRASDLFGVEIAGLAGPVEISNASFRAELLDLRGQKYEIGL